MPQTKVISIRAEDLPRLTECAERFFAVSKTPGIFNLQHFVNTWTCILTSDFGVIFAVEEQGKVIGAIGGILHPDGNTGELIAAEAFWYVLEEHRNGLSGIYLFRALLRWARERQCAHLHMGYLLASMPADIQRFYERMEFVEIERVFSKPLNNLVP